MFNAHKEGGSDAPFRFLYMSGVASERDQSKTPKWKPEYCLMRVSLRKLQSFLEELCLNRPVWSLIFA